MVLFVPRCIGLGFRFLLGFAGLGGILHWRSWCSCLFWPGFYVLWFRGACCRRSFGWSEGMIGCRVDRVAFHSWIRRLKTLIIHQFLEQLEVFPWSWVASLWVAGHFKSCKYSRKSKRNRWNIFRSYPIISYQLCSKPFPS